MLSLTFWKKLFPSLGAVSLDTLLQMFVSQERVSTDVMHSPQKVTTFFQVEGRALKQNTFGKLPECLCFHVQVFYTLSPFSHNGITPTDDPTIFSFTKFSHEYIPSQRTGFGGGQPYKRHDYVEFPVLLNMDRSV